MYSGRRFFYLNTGIILNRNCKKQELFSIEIEKTWNYSQ